MSNQNEGFAGLPQHLQPSNLPAQEPSATPSTLERLIGEVRELHGEATQGVVLVDVSILVALESALAALRPSEGPPKDCDLPSAADVLGILERPSEGPETGRPPSTTLERLIEFWRSEASSHDKADSDREFHEAKADTYRTCADDLAALPAGPETGDRERLRALAKATADRNHERALDAAGSRDWLAGGHKHERDTCPHIDCVLVRQAAPAAAPAPAQAESLKE